MKTITMPLEEYQKELEFKEKLVMTQATKTEL